MITSSNEHVFIPHEHRNQCTNEQKRNNEKKLQIKTAIKCAVHTVAYKF